MKKTIILFSLFFLLSCVTKDTTVYIEKQNFNSLTKVEIDNIHAIGKTKLKEITDELKNGEFLNEKDFESRMEEKLSPVMIKEYVIIFLLKQQQQQLMEVLNNGERNYRKR
jgi:hypothetical protein